MSYYYSPSANAFFNPEITAVPVPEDAVELSDLDHAALMAELASGKELTAGVDGAPTTVPRVPRSTPPTI